MDSQQAQISPIDLRSYRLILEDVGLWRGTTTILKGINWRVRPGEHWAVLGANGSGKTSLILAISGYLPFGGGRIFLLDGWIGKINLVAQRKKIAIVSQSHSEYIAARVANITAVEVVLTGLFSTLRLFDEVTGKQRQQALNILTELGCGELAETRFDLLSTGERQACLIARSKMAKSELLLLDEPCAGLDLAARERFLLTLEAMIASEGSPTSVLITHHPEEIVSGISHVLLLRAGAVVAAGPKAEVLTPDLLSQTFDMRLQVTEDHGRYWVQASST